MTTVLHLEVPPRAPTTHRFALWDLGLRPFYLLAGADAAAPGRRPPADG